jgi:hypothetical protein
MLVASLVRASVVDIRRECAVPRRLVCDTNVLYWIFYPSFRSLASAGGIVPGVYQTTEYARFFTVAHRSQTALCTSAANLGELAKLIEHADLESHCRTDCNCPADIAVRPGEYFAANQCKKARYHYAGRLPTIRRGVEHVIASVRKAVSILPGLASTDDEHQSALSEWLLSYSDYVDALMIAQARRLNMVDILSDDGDFATVSGITLYTANRNVVNAARAAGTLKL